MPDGLTFGAVVLAAGAGSRLGGRPKCLLQLDGVPLMRRTLAALAGAGVRDVVVVLGHHAAAIEPVLNDLPVRRVRNPEPDVGPVSSQRIGLAALPPTVDAVLMVLADQPLLEAADIAALMTAWRQRPRGCGVVQPWVGGERANPVVLGEAVRRELLAGPVGLGCRQWQQAHPAQVQAWVTDNGHYRVDIDTPEDMADFERSTGRRLRWPSDAA